MLPTLNILCFGDSLTEGYSNYGARFTPYSKWLKSKLEAKLSDSYYISIETDGVSGDLVTRGFRRRMERQCKIQSSSPSNFFYFSREGKITGFLDKLGKQGISMPAPKPQRDDEEEDDEEEEEDDWASFGRQAERETDSPNNLNQDPFDWVLFLGGTNDLGWGMKPLDIWDEIKSITQIPLDAGTRVLFMTIPECATKNAGLDTRRDALNKLITEDKRENVFVFDLHTHMPFHSLGPEERDRLWDDGLHFTPAGYEKIGSILSEKLLEIMSTPSSASTSHAVTDTESKS